MNTTLASLCAAFSLGFLMPASALAGPEDFGPGPLIQEFGQIAPVDVDMPIPDGTEFRVVFDLVDGADAGTLNRGLLSAARFLNMHVANGVPAEDLHLAVVVHGGAVQDVTNNAHYFSVTQTNSANMALIDALRAHGVEIYVCGQSAAYYDVSNDDLHTGVNMALSAMTAHALLQQDGYTLNPF
jgi:intracellular sulfur oxidation DsrE/DsrF family protein